MDPDAGRAMSYIHQGEILCNGAVDLDSVQTGSPDHALKPEDDGFHIVDPVPGDFEWWYFDLVDENSGCFLKVVIHIGTDPLKTRIWPQLAVSLKTPGYQGSFSESYDLNDIEADTSSCSIAIKDQIRVWAQTRDQPEYHIRIDLSQFQCKLKFISTLEGWKPFGNEVRFKIGNRTSAFSWTIPVPRARVEGEFFFENKKFTIADAIGYHDHNYVRIDRQHPLHLDGLVSRWYWGKAYVDRFTVIFGDIYCKTNRIISFMVAENKKIIHSSNNIIDCQVMATGYDHSLKVKYPASISIRLDTADLPLQATFNFDGVMDRKDLLEGINPVLRWLIKRMVARPVYHGLRARVRLNLSDHSWDGFGNYESMMFRNIP